MAGRHFEALFVIPPLSALSGVREDLAQAGVLGVCSGDCH